VFFSGICSETEVSEQLYYAKQAADSPKKSAGYGPRKGLEGRGAFPKGMERSGTPESPVSGAESRKCAQIFKKIFVMLHCPGGIDNN
jgi:hypothetical protein